MRCSSVHFGPSRSLPVSARGVSIDAAFVDSRFTFCASAPETTTISASALAAAVNRKPIEASSKLLPSGGYPILQIPRHPKPDELRTISTDCLRFLHWRSMMISRRSILLISTAFLTEGSVSALAASAKDPIKMFDLDSDGTLDLAEVKKAATTLFARLDPDHDGTLDKHELTGRMTARELAAADPDHDGTLSLDEYLAVVEKRFHAANPDNDGTLDARELRTRARRSLLRLLN
jgi:Ca2+-binding EF-hand superfamily protein